MGAILAAILVFCVAYAVGFCVAAYYAWAISILWGWFIVPMGAPPVGVLHIIGISLVVGMFTHGLAKVEVEGEKARKTLVGLLLGPLFTLLFGYIVHCLGG